MVDRNIAPWGRSAEPRLECGLTTLARPRTLRLLLVGDRVATGSTPARGNRQRFKLVRASEPPDAKLIDVTGPGRMDPA